MTPKRKLDSDSYTVVCRHHDGIDACAPWQRVMIVIQGVRDAQEAADNACLYLIWGRQGRAEAEFVIEGSPKLFNVHGGVFDAEEFDETITFTGKIVSVLG